MNEYIVILGTSEAGVEAVSRCGYKPIVVSSRSGCIPEMIVRYAENVFFADYTNKEETLTVCKELSRRYDTIRLVISFTELGLESAAYVSENLGLPTNSLESVITSRNKETMRNCFKEDNELTLHYYGGSVSDLPEEFPFTSTGIIKPCNGFASKDVSFIKNNEEWKRWKGSVKESTGSWILEPFIDGHEYSVETISYNGDHYILGITQKETTGIPHFIEKSHFVPAQINTDRTTKTKSIVIKALDKIGILYGPCHVEIKWDNNRDIPVIIELHTRPGGDSIPKLHQLVNGKNQYELGILSFFNDFTISIREISNDLFSCIRFFFWKTGTLKSLGFIEKDYALHENILEWKSKYKPGDQIEKVTDSYVRAGYVISCSQSPEQSLQAVESFINNLIVQIE